MLWWWALDHAFDGDLSSFDALDIADAAGWDGDPEQLVDALIGCGPGDKCGFLDPDWTLHDWGEFTAALRAARRSSVAGNHTRHHVNKGVTSPDCELCDSPPVPDGPPDGSRGTPTGQGGDSTYLPTQPTNPKPSPSLDGDNEPPGESDAEDPEQQRIDASFTQFWDIYPTRNGKKVGRGKAAQQWRKLSWEQRRRAYTGAKHLAVSDTLPKDPVRFLRPDTAGEFPFDDWQTPATLDGKGPSPPARPDQIVGTAEWEQAQAERREAAERLTGNGRPGETSSGDP